MNERQQLGGFGERVAAHRLESLGMHVIDRNVRVGRAELDLVARDGEEIVVVEVRTRRGAAGLAAESLTPAKLRRLWHAAMGYAEANGIDPERVRVDVVAVELDGKGTARNVEHFRGIDIPPGEDD
ncbi:MAG: YraN family protein [Chloroflexi bacterium]|nr:YraN family protein [Dehalococcoidia bacterium]MCO5201529.1 YraN family protein [Chloroflexota bacterium]NJD64940.1 YraN family protein [Chloroflexota bacterium]PWB42202.1 MAG: YraN family protein [Dehalococcoidia bacterium]